MKALFDVARDLGCTEAWVGTEHDNDSARGLYANVGGEAEPFVMYTFNLEESSTQ